VVLAGADKKSQRAQRTTLTVDRLRRIGQQRREELSRNDRKLRPAGLNELIPEIDAIELMNTASDGKPGKTLRLIAWNMERGRHWRDAVRLIQEHPALRNPDIVFLGEMDLGMARSLNQHTTREMAAALNMNYAYGVEFLELTKGEKQEREQYPGENEWGYHGNAILSRYRLGNLRMLRFPGIEKWYGDYQNRLGGRMALFATVMIPRPVTLVSTHLESSRGDIGPRQSQMEMILRELGETAARTPVFLGGDLNATPEEPAISNMRKAGFAIEESNEMGVGTAQRFRGGQVVLGNRHIDYLCVRDAEVIRDDTSPKVVPAVYPPGPKGKMLGDHAVVSVRVQLPGV
jgi:endonuclease/exonuclease/phosphatase family metal-dependent hydrolase